MVAGEAVDKKTVADFRLRSGGGEAAVCLNELEQLRAVAAPLVNLKREQHFPVHVCIRTRARYPICIMKTRRRERDEARKKRAHSVSTIFLG